jgi:hypothetical protein
LAVRCRSHRLARQPFLLRLAPKARDKVAKLASRDWTDFLRRRADELKPGGWFFVDGLSSIPDPGDPSGICAAGRGLYRAFWQIAASLAADGSIDPGLLEEFVFPVYFRLSEEIRAPLERETDLRDTFEIVELANEHLASPYEDDLRKTGDVAAYASAYAGFARAFAESTLRSGLFEGSKTKAGQADELTNEYFRRLQDLFATEPGRHPFEHQVMTLVLRRR